jgi:hypothetical protein
LYVPQKSNASEWNSKGLLLFLFHGTEFQVVFSSAEWFRTEFRECASIVVTRNRIPSIFLFRGMVQNEIQRVCFYFVQLYRTFFYSKEWFGPEFLKFSVLRNSRNSAGTNQLFRLFRVPRKIFCRKLLSLRRPCS